jgi:succinoglycan biosynthesis protein ExoU
MSRSFVDRRGLRYDERLRPEEDYDLYVRALALGARSLAVPAQGYVSVIRADSITNRHTQADLERLRDINIKLGTITTLVPFERRALNKYSWSVDARVQWLLVMEALKARRPTQLLGPFLRHSTVSCFLVRQLSGEVITRSRKMIRVGEN